MRLTDLLKPIERLIEEHGSSTIQGKHIALLKEQLAALHKEALFFSDQLQELEAENEQLKMENANLRQKANELSAVIQKNRHADRPEPEHRIILLLLEHDGLDSREIAKKLSMGEQAVRHHITQLDSVGLIQLIPLLGPNSKWYLSDEGRAYLHARGLIE